MCYQRKVSAWPFLKILILQRQILIIVLSIRNWNIMGVFSWKRRSSKHLKGALIDPQKPGFNRFFFIQTLWRKQTPFCPFFLYKIKRNMKMFPRVYRSKNTSICSIEAKPFISKLKEYVNHMFSMDWIYQMETLMNIWGNFIKFFYSFPTEAQIPPLH